MISRFLAVRCYSFSILYFHYWFCCKLLSESRAQCLSLGFFLLTCRCSRFRYFRISSMISKSSSCRRFLNIPSNPYGLSYPYLLSTEHSLLSSWPLLIINFDRHLIIFGFHSFLHSFLASKHSDCETIEISNLLSFTNKEYFSVNTCQKGCIYFDPKYYSRWGWPHLSSQIFIEN